MRAILLVLAAGWWDCGHMVIAEIASQNIDAKFAERLNSYARALFSDPAQHARAWQKQPDDFSAGFVEEAPAFDALKDAFDFSADWHFTSIGIDAKGELIPMPEQPQNVSWAVNEGVTYFLKGLKKLGKEHYTDVANQVLGASFWLQAVVHLVGDAHQPMHAVNYVSKEFPLPEGDRGGNEFKLGTPLSHPFHGKSQKVKDLHMLWDAAGGFCMSPDAPVSKADISKMVRPLAEEVMKDHPLEEVAKKVQIKWSKYKLSVYESWTKETAEIARKNAYFYPKDGKFVPLKNGTNVTKEYLDNAQDVARWQIAKAGYRLAALLNASASNWRQLPAGTAEVNEVVTSPVAPLVGTAVAALGAGLFLGLAVGRARRHNGARTDVSIPLV